MEKNNSIEIVPVANGFIVRPTVSPGSCMAETNIEVYQTMKELVIFLKGHFEHRTNTVAADS